MLMYQTCLDGGKGACGIRRGGGGERKIGAF